MGDDAQSGFTNLSSSLLVVDLSGHEISLWIKGWETPNIDREIDTSIY